MVKNNPNEEILSPPTEISTGNIYPTLADHSSFFKLTGSAILKYMTATAHGIAGGAIASLIPDPVIGLSLATISHPLLDLVPHWDLGRDWQKQGKFMLAVKSLADLGVGYLAAYLLFYNSSIPIWYFFAAITLSTGWDVATGPYLLFKWWFPPFSWLYKFQSSIQSDTKTPFWGILTQIIFIVFLISLVNILN